MSAATMEAEVLALRQALMQAEERVAELTDLAAQLRRRLALRQTHDDERYREMKATIAQLRRRPDVRGGKPDRPEVLVGDDRQPPEPREAPKPLARARERLASGQRVPGRLGLL